MEVDSRGLLLSLRLSFHAPLNPENLFGHLAATAVPGVEEVRDGVYRRTLRLPRGIGIAELAPRADHVACRLSLSDERDAEPAVARCRWLLDLDADPEAIDGQLSDDPDLRPLVSRGPGRRVPRCVEGPELAVRAVLGQQISTAAARTHAGRLAAEFGEPVTDPRGGLTRLFPTAEALIGAKLAMPASRGRTLAGLLGALTAGELSLEPGSDPALARSALERLPGIGDWTTEMIAMRALGDPDAFPVTDLGIRRGAEVLGLPRTPARLLDRAARWRPWRAYAVQYLWATNPHSINEWPRRQRVG